jgi:hypothetical protein
MRGPKAELVFSRRVTVSEKAFVELVLWRVPRPVPGSAHDFKYRLALVRLGVCVLRYDNEAGKGDHRHLGNTEFPYIFSGVERLVADFNSDVLRWLDENVDD